MKHQVIFGPPGTGKSRTLVTEVTEHVQVIPDAKVLMCSHTKAAAQTLIERWGTESKAIDIQTLHSFCFRATGCSRDQTVDDKRMESFIQHFGMGMGDGDEGRVYVELMSYARAVGGTWQQVYENSNRPGGWKHFESFIESYAQWKHANGYVDFTDMLERYIMNARAGQKYTLLAIDEAQDLTPLHWKVIDKIMALNPKCQVMIAGDDDQCIYGHTGADPAGASWFAERQGADVRVLEQSYRVPGVVHELAQRIARKIKKRVPKNYLPRDAGGQVVYNDRGFEYEFKKYLGEEDLRDCMILYSDKFIRRDHVEQALMDLALPFTAVSGFPAPMQTKAGMTMQLAHKEGELSNAEQKTFIRGLSEKGAAVFKSIGFETVRDRLKAGDCSLVSTYWANEEYFRRLDWRRPANIRISTIHGAKGMEAANVHLITGQSDAATDQAIRNPDAQHRLFYVGATRAAEGLFVYPGVNNYEMPRVA